MTYTQETTCQIPELAKLYDEVFGDIRGVFVDIGAHNGRYCSNTYGLVMAGWSGICVEPVKSLFVACSLLYADYPVIVLNQAVTNYTGVARLYMTGNPTINLGIARSGPWGFAYDLNYFVDVPCTTLDEILTKFMRKPEFQVLSIDVEGAELEVLDGFDMKHWKPRMVILETHKHNPNLSYRVNSVALDERMIGAGFYEIYADAINSIYLRDD